MCPLALEFSGDRDERIGALEASLEPAIVVDDRFRADCGLGQRGAVFATGRNLPLELLHHELLRFELHESALVGASLVKPGLVVRARACRDRHRCEQRREHHARDSRKPLPHRCLPAVFSHRIAEYRAPCSCLRRACDVYDRFTKQSLASTNMTPVARQGKDSTDGADGDPQSLMAADGPASEARWAQLVADWFEEQAGLVLAEPERSRGASDGARADARAGRER